MADARRANLGWPIPQMWLFGGTFTGFYVDGATDKVEQIFQMPEAATITHVGFRYQLRDGTPPEYKVGLQSVGGDGNPSGTFLQSGNFTPPADATWNDTWRWIALDGSYSAAQGELLALVIEPVGTPSGADRSQFTVSYSALTTQQFPYSINNAAGTRTRSTSCPAYGVKSSTKAYGNIIENFSNVTFSSTTNPDEYAQRFNLPAGWGSTYKIAGVTIKGQTAAAGKTLVINLYDGTTVLQSVTIDSDQLRVASTVGIATYYFSTANLATLNFGQDYRIGFQAQEAASNWSLNFLEVDVAFDLSAYAAGDAFLGQSTRENGGSNSWTDNNTRRALLELIIDDWTEPSAGGGGPLIGPGRLVRV